MKKNIVKKYSPAVKFAQRAKTADKLQLETESCCERVEFGTR